MKYFKTGNILFGIVYTIWRGVIFLQSRLSTWFYRSVLEESGSGSLYLRDVYVSHPKRIRVGKNSIIGQAVSMTSEDPKGELIIKDFVQISEGTRIDFTGKVTIDSHTLISPWARIMTHDHGYDPHSSPTCYDLEIGEHAWIGLDAIILPGVGKIGKYAIVGVGAIVTKPVPDYAIVAGNPAKVIKIRPDAPEAVRAAFAERSG